LIFMEELTPLMYMPRSIDSRKVPTIVVFGGLNAAQKLDSEDRSPAWRLETGEINSHDAGRLSAFHPRSMCHRFVQYMKHPIVNRIPGECFLASSKIRHPAVPLSLETQFKCLSFMLVGGYVNASPDLQFVGVF